MSTKPPIEPIQWTHSSVRGFLNPITKLVQGVMHRCTACGDIFKTYKEAREHVIYECESEKHHDRSTQRPT